MALGAAEAGSIAADGKTREFGCALGFSSSLPFAIVALFVLLGGKGCTPQPRHLVLFSNMLIYPYAGGVHGYSNSREPHR
ncbi:hypothetical protein BDY21DRAFT_337154 [Lineolata rhizophorae]|uniref:Uncharacterized protein n=1 Tax=Lineolata rhizophorae TaxID=578093 RepID=A0A6A6P843_9PEZI|nr:hypothetical protein BDY21DRAFT_337154 [Lineolata rhizophorae]